MGIGATLDIRETQMDATAQLFKMIAAYVRGEIAIADLYAWTAVQDAGFGVEGSATADWDQRAGELWSLLHEHYSEGRSEDSVRAELVSQLCPDTVEWSGRAQATIAASSEAVVVIGQAWQPTPTRVVSPFQFAATAA